MTHTVSGRTLKGAFRKPPKKPGKPGEKYQFEALLLEMLRSVNMHREVTPIINLRNEIIHSGLSQTSHTQQWRMYEHVQDLVREYLIRLLCYHGEFLTYAERS